MRKDQYILHDVTTRTNRQVIDLIEKEGAGGYGFYWAIMEYLRTQDDYVGSLHQLRAIARQMKMQQQKAYRIVMNYQLFVVENDTFYSRKLNERMQPYERKQVVTTAKVQRKLNENATKNTDNSLEINEGDEKNNEIPYNIKKEIKKENNTSSSTNEEEVEAAAEAEEAVKESVRTPAWERYVDALDDEEQWKELMAMRSGLKRQFFSLYPRIVECFKRHVRLIGNESRILSLSDAKHYFCFFITPGSNTYKRVMEELRNGKADGAAYEECDSKGVRSYCGVIIPANAPPRPNAQAVWNGKKWVY